MPDFTIFGGEENFHHEMVRVVLNGVRPVR